MRDCVWIWTKKSARDADWNAKRASILSGYMVAKFEEETAPFPHACPQRSFSRDSHACFISYLLHSSHKNPCSQLFSTGPNIFFPFFFSFLIFFKKLFLIKFRNYWKLDEGIFVGIEVGQTLVIDDPYGDFRVTAVDANHCPGKIFVSLMRFSGWSC